MDFKAALLKRQPTAAAASVFRPTAGNSSASGKEQVVRVTDSFNPWGDEGRNDPMRHMRNRSRRRHLDSGTSPRADVNFKVLPTIIETGPTPPMTSESPCAESWTYMSPRDRPALTALQAIALRARDRLALRIQAEFSRQARSALALNRLRDQVFAQLQCQLDVVTAPAQGQAIVEGPVSLTDAYGLNIQLSDSQAKDEEINRLKEALEKEQEGNAKVKHELAAMSGAFVQLKGKVAMYKRRVTVLEKEKEEVTLKVQEYEATIEAFGKPRIPLSRSSSTSSSCADSDRVMSSSSISSGGSPSSERELAFSTFNTLALRRKATASSAATLAPPKPASLAHHRGSSLPQTVITMTESAFAPRPLNNVSNVVNNEYGYLSFTLPSKATRAKMVDPPTLTGAGAASFDLTTQL